MCLGRDKRPGMDLHAMSIISVEATIIQPRDIGRVLDHRAVQVNARGAGKRPGTTAGLDEASPELVGDPQAFREVVLNLGCLKEIGLWMMSANGGGPTGGAG